jgi:hypothetical protein
LAEEVKKEVKKEEKKKTLYDKAVEHPIITVIVLVLVATAVYVLVFKNDIDVNGSLGFVLTIRSAFQKYAVWIVLGAAVLWLFVWMSKRAVTKREHVSHEQMALMFTEFLWKMSGGKIIASPMEVEDDEYPTGSGIRMVGVPRLKIWMPWDQVYQGATMFGKTSPGFKGKFIDDLDMRKRQRLKDDFERQSMRTYE